MPVFSPKKFFASSPPPQTPIHGLVLDVSGIDDVDYTAAKMLLQGRSELNKRGVTVVSVAISVDTIDNLRRYGRTGDLDKRVYPTIDAAIAALGARGSHRNTVSLSVSPSALCVRQ
jgi:MFS superfamily sulfate permease-like transporter